MKPVINWSYNGPTDISCGTGATNAERYLGYTGGFLGLILYIYFFIQRIYPWNWWQYIIGGILAFDVAGGLICNCLNSCKRFYSTPLQPNEQTLIVRIVKTHWIFTMIHIHPFIIQICFGTFDHRYYGLFWYFNLQLNALILMKSPLYLRRPLSMLFCLISLIFNCYIITKIDGFEWFIPSLFIKILYGHLVQEEPYRPIEITN